ncbi:MAG: IS481 family transposase [Opitutaceae bacterium]|nr:IS481 family transposase [Opitutaceae bacterium]
MHANARTTPCSRADIVRLVEEEGQTLKAAAAAFSVCPKTVRKWVERYRREGGTGLRDRSSRPTRSPKRITAVRSDERQHTAVDFLKQVVAHYRAMGITVQRILTDNGSCYKSAAFRKACLRLGIKHKFTRPYTPKTNGKAERFIQSALREWAYARTYQHSAERTAALPLWLQRYNWRRPHRSLQRKPPISRLHLEDNLLTSHI